MGYLRIVLSIFSGRKDPECIICDDDPEYQRIKEMLKTTRTGELRSILGYRGFVVTDHSKFNRRTKIIPKDSNNDLEMYLFDVCKFDSNLRPYSLEKHDS